MAIPTLDENYRPIKKEDVIERSLHLTVHDKKSGQYLDSYVTIRQFRWLTEHGVTFNQQAVLGAAGLFLDILHPTEEMKMSKLIEETFGYKRHATTTEWRAISALLAAGMIRKGEKGYINTYRSR